MAVVNRYPSPVESAGGARWIVHVGCTTNSCNPARKFPKYDAMNHRSIVHGCLWLACVALLPCRGAAAEWEPKLAEGAETDLIALNLASGNKAGADYVEGDDLTVELRSVEFEGLRPIASRELARHGRSARSCGTASCRV